VPSSGRAEGPRPSHPLHPLRCNAATRSRSSATTPPLLPPPSPSPTNLCGQRVEKVCVSPPDAARLYTCRYTWQENCRMGPVGVQILYHPQRQLHAESKLIHTYSHPNEEGCCDPQDALPPVFGQVSYIVYTYYVPFFVVLCVVFVVSSLRYAAYSWSYALSRIYYLGRAYPITNQFIISSGALPLICLTDKDHTTDKLID